MLENETPETEIPEQEPTEEITAEPKQSLPPQTASEPFMGKEIQDIFNQQMEAEQRKFQEKLDNIERQYKEKEFQLYARDKLVQAGLPADMLAHLKASDDASLMETITALNSIIHERVQVDVLRRMAGISPMAGDDRPAYSESKNIRDAMGLN